MSAIEMEGLQSPEWFFPRPLKIISRLVTLPSPVALGESDGVITTKQINQRKHRLNMKRTLLALALLGGISLVNAQEKLSKDEALPYAQAVSKHLGGTPIATDVDVEQPAAVRDGEYGGMVLPQKNLKVEALAHAGKTAVPIGQLWLKQLTPVQDGEAVGQEKLRLVNVSGDGQEITAPQCALAVRRNSQGVLELLVYGKGKEPVATSTLKPVDSTQTLPLDLTAEREGDNGKVTLKILGKYQATLTVTELLL